MEQMPPDMLPYAEAAIYLPMLLAVLEKDYQLLEQGEFKLKRPYLYLIAEARECIQKDLKKAKAYLEENSMSIMRGNRDDLFTEYYFHFVNTVVVRRYSNIRLRNHSEQLLNVYLHQNTIETD